MYADGWWDVCIHTGLPQAGIALVRRPADRPPSGSGPLLASSPWSPCAFFRLRSGFDSWSGRLRLGSDRRAAPSTRVTESCRGPARTSCIYQRMPDDPDMLLVSRQICKVRASTVTGANRAAAFVLQAGSSGPSGTGGSWYHHPTESRGPAAQKQPLLRPALGLGWVNDWDFTSSAAAQQPFGGSQAAWRDKGYDLVVVIPGGSQDMKRYCWFLFQKIESSQELLMSFPFQKS